jgi:histone acetyltransferase 1
VTVILLELSDHYTDEASFSARVREDATAFKPLGDLIYSYARPSPGAVGKVKGASVVNLDSEDAVVFEVYHVRLDLTNLLKCPKVMH